MDIEQARTFLVIAANGSFIGAAEQLHLTQSTISARIKRLEEELQVSLFKRDRSGASLTPAGRRFLEYAKRLVTTEKQAKHDVGLSSRYHSTLRVGGRIALWESFLPQWVGKIRQAIPDVAIRSEIGFEEDLMRHLIAGNLDIGLMYTPNHSPGLIVEHLFNEVLVLISSRENDTGPGHDYVFVEWGPGFYNKHAQMYPDLEKPAQIANIGWLGIQLILENGGSCYLPRRMAEPFVNAGTLYRVENSPEFIHPAYMVYPREYDNIALDRAIELLRGMKI